MKAHIELNRESGTRKMIMTMAATILVVLMVLVMMKMMKRREKRKCLTAFGPSKNTDLSSFWPFLQNSSKLPVHLRKKLPSQITLEERYYIEPSIDKLQYLKLESRVYYTSTN